MSKRRWRASLTALAVVALTAAGTTATVRTATAAEPELRPVGWICYLDEGSAEGEALTKEASVQTSDGRYTVALDHALCTKALPEDDGTQPELDLSYFLDRYPGLAVFKDGELPESITFVQCGERGGTLGSASPNGLPTVDGLRHDCSLEVPEGARSATSDGGLGGLGGGFGGGMTWGSGEGMPTSDSVDCSGGGTLANPWAAEGSGGGKTNGQLGWQMFRQWLQGVGTAYGASKAASTGNSTGIVLASGALSAFEAWGQSVADSVGKDLEARYRDSSASLAKQADAFADQAEQDAAAVAAASPGSPESVTSAQAAQQARAAADAAAKAAQTASTSTDRGEIGAAYRAALKSDQDAKEAAEKAAQDRQTVEGGTTEMPGGPDGSQQACEQLRQQLWECEQSGWDSSSCQQLANMLEGCQADMTVALVTEDGQLCGSAYLDPDVAQAALDKACGLQVSKYGPDADPCGQYVDGVATISHYDGCDPAVAYGGCPSETGETVKLPDRGVFCFEVPSVLPPVPCFQIGGAPDSTPVLGYLVDSTGTLYMPDRDGIRAVGGVDREMLPPYILTP